MAKYISRAAIAAAALALGVSGTYATQWGTGDLVVSVTVDPTCNITGVDPIVFSKIPKGATTTEDMQPSAIHVSCNSGGWHLSPVSDFADDVRSMIPMVRLRYTTSSANPPRGHTPAAQRSIRVTAIPGSDLTSTITIYAVMEGEVFPAISGTYTDTVTIQLTN